MEGSLFIKVYILNSVPHSLCMSTLSYQEWSANRQKTSPHYLPHFKGCHIRTSLLYSLLWSHSYIFCLCFCIKPGLKFWERGCAILPLHSGERRWWWRYVLKIISPILSARILLLRCLCFCIDQWQKLVNISCHILQAATFTHSSLSPMLSDLTFSICIKPGLKFWERGCGATTNAVNVGGGGTLAMDWKRPSEARGWPVLSKRNPMAEIAKFHPQIIACLLLI